MTQPPPKPSDTPAVWPLVVADVRSGLYDFPRFWRDRLAAEMEARDTLGRERYGTPLQVDNGRDPLRDLLDEALDACAYSRQQAEKTGTAVDWETHRLCVALAARVLWRMHLRDEEAKG